MNAMEALVYLLLFGLSFCVFFFLFFSMTYRRRRWRKYDLRHFFTDEQHASRMEKAVAKFYKQAKIDEYRQLLAGCGIPLQPAVYLLIKNGCLVICGIGWLVNYALGQSVFTWGAAAVYAFAAMFLLDRWIMDKLSRHRSDRIAREIYLVSYHLLYYQGSKLNIHAKLRRCMPQTRMIRKEMQLLLNEWYEHAETALLRFRERLGTEEACSFAETIESLIAKDDQEYYDLLRQRVADYKQKMAMVQESRTETHSYVLFVLAGIPLLNTFRVFIYPWVEEGMRLFQTLH